MACYVPFCESVIPYKKGAKRESNISFHQFPNDPEVRKKWIMAIAKKDPKTGAYWDPFSAAMVCSLHFSPKQFKGTAKRILKNGSIPFIFPDYYLPQRGALIRQADLSSMKIIPAPGNVDKDTSKQGSAMSILSSNAHQISLVDNTYSNTNNNQNTKKKRTFSEMSPSQIDNVEIIAKHSNSSKPILHPKIILVKNVKKLAISQTDERRNLISKIPSNVDLAAKNCGSAPEISANSLPNVNFTSSPIQNILDSNTDTSENTFQNKLNALTEINKYLLTKLNSEINETSRLKGELFKMKEENEKFKSANKIKEEMLELFNLEELKKGISSSNDKALFLFDQLRNLTQKKCTWYRSTIEFANNLEKELPECYSFLKRADILTLPPPKNVSCSDYDVVHVE